MTTIAYRDGVIAADSLINLSGDKVGHGVKVGSFRNGIFGVCGDASAIAEFKKKMLGYTWLPVDEADDKLSTLSFDPYAPLGEFNNMTAIMVTDQHRVFLFNGTGEPLEIFDEFTAQGSGAASALGAMHCGADAYEAVSIACKVDVFSALPIHIVKLPS